MFEYSLQVNHILSFSKDYSDCAEGECFVLTDISIYFLVAFWFNLCFDFSFKNNYLFNNFIQNNKTARLHKLISE